MPPDSSSRCVRGRLGCEVSVVVHKCGACELVHVGNPFVLPLELLEVPEFVLWVKD